MTDIVLTAPDGTDLRDSLTRKHKRGWLRDPLGCSARSHRARNHIERIARAGVI